MTDPMKPSAALLAKLGSIARHCDEALSVTGHEFDVGAIRSLLCDPEVVQWLDAMDKLAMIPRKR
jgi:hypothetical protein